MLVQSPVMIADTPVIHLENVTLSRSGLEILKGISWRVRRGEHWAIVGANGSGKTTMLKMAAGTLSACGSAWNAQRAGSGRRSRAECNRGDAMCRNFRELQSFE